MKRQRSVRFFQAHQLRERLGLNPGKLPKEERKWCNVEGLSFHLLPAPAISQRSRPHRLLVKCLCGKWMSAGRFNQHQGMHEKLSDLSKGYLEGSK